MENSAQNAKKFRTAKKNSAEPTHHKREIISCLIYVYIILIIINFIFCLPRSIPFSAPSSRMSVPVVVVVVVVDVVTGRTRER